MWVPETPPEPFWGKMPPPPRSKVSGAVWGVICRLIIIPVITVAVLKLLHLPQMIYNVALIIALMPTSCASVIIVGKYGGDVDYSGQQLLLSTLLSPATVTGFLYLSTLF